tara:strand:+ start:181 stop:1134 length:954 start_codon:yes stop_codon:yes gene_type:complete
MPLSKIKTNSVADEVFQSGSNFIINGSLQTWQRGTSMASSGNGANNYTADRFWVSHNNSSNVTVSRQDGTGAGIGVQYCARVQRNSGSSAANGIRYGTSLEATDVIGMRGKILTLSYYARAGADFSPTSNAMPVYLFTGTDVDPNPNTFAGGSWNNTVGLVNTTSTLTTSWQRFTHTTAAVSSTANAIILQFNATETGTAGANDYFEITGVQLEISDSATPFQHEDIGTTLRKCKRYYVKDPFVIVRNQEGTGQFFQWLEFPVEMRATPTVTVSNPTYSNADTLYAFNATSRGFEAGLNATAATGYAFFTYEANKEL